MRFSRLYRFQQSCDQLLEWSYDVASPATVVLVSEGILRQRLAQALEHSVVVHDYAAFFTGEYSVCSGYSLHQVVRLHRLVDVERRQALHVEARQPHRADDGHAEGVLWVFE